MSNLIGEPFEKYVNRQIIARQKLHGSTQRTLEQITYLNSRNAWIKIASGVELTPRKYEEVTKDLPNSQPIPSGSISDGGKLAKNWVLFNGLSTYENERETEYYNDPTKDVNKYVNHFEGNKAGIKSFFNPEGAYGIGGTNFGYVPMPGIVDANLKCLNRGSIKKTTIKIKAHNRVQFNIIDTLYLRLGYSIFVEWGYDKYIDNEGELQTMYSSLIDEKFFDDEFKKSDYSKWIPEIDKKRENTDGNYEGIFGTVSNFSWTFQDDGTYDIKLEVISLGDIIESLRANLPPIGKRDNVFSDVVLADNQRKFGKVVATQEQFYEEIFPNLEDYLTDIYNNYITKKASFISTELLDFSRRSEAKFSNLILLQDFVPYFDSPAWKTIYTNIGPLFKQEQFIGYSVKTIEQQSRELLDKGDIPQPNIPQNIEIVEFEFDEDGNIIGTVGDDINTGATDSELGDLDGNVVTRRVSFERNLEWLKIDVDISSAPSFKGLIDANTKFIKDNEYIEKGLMYAIYRYLLVNVNDDTKGGRQVNRYEDTTKLTEDLGQVFEEGEVIETTEAGRTYPTLPGVLDLNTPEGNYSISWFQPSMITSTTELNFWGMSLSFLLKSFYQFAVYQQFAGGTGDNRLNTEELDTELPEEEDESKIQYEEYGGAQKNRISAYLTRVMEYQRASGLGTKFESTIQDTKMIPHKMFPSKTDFDKFKKAIGYPYYNSSRFRNAFAGFITGVNNLSSYYMKLGVFLDFFEERIIPKIESTKKPLITINTSRSKNICYVTDNSISSNPKKLIVRNKNFYAYPKKNKINPGLDQFIATRKGIKYGLIMNIYFSFDRLIKIFDKVDTRDEVSVFKVLKELCKDINECLGMVNNIEPVIKENNEIRLIDQTPIPGLDEIKDEFGVRKDSEEDAVLEVFGYKEVNDFDDEGTTNLSTFVNKIGITTEINKKYATMITIGATSQGSIPGLEATAFSKWNEGILDRFKNNIVDAKKFKSKGTKIDKLEDQNENVIENYKNFLVNREPLLGYTTNVHPLFNDEVIPINQSVIEKWNKFYQAKSSILSNSAKSSVGFMPFNMKVSMDGIGGIKIYNKLKVNTKFLPSNYGDELEFIITGVDHKISDNGWETSLSTIATSNSKNIKEIKTYSTKEILAKGGDITKLDEGPVEPPGWDTEDYWVRGEADVPEWMNPGNKYKTIKYDKKSSFGSDVLKYYIPELKALTGTTSQGTKITRGLKILAMIMVNKEGFHANPRGSGPPGLGGDSVNGTRSFRFNNPANIGNTDSGANKAFDSLKDGIVWQLDYLYGVATGTNKFDPSGKEIKISRSYPIGKTKKIKPYFSEEVALREGYNPYLPGYEFTYTGKIKEFVKIYSTGARGTNSYISTIASFFRLNGYTMVDENTTLTELVALDGTEEIIIPS